MSTDVHLVVRDGSAVDSIVIDPTTAEQWQDDGTAAGIWGDGCALVDVTNHDPQPGIGWSYDGTDWTAPAPPPKPEPPVEPEP